MKLRCLKEKDAPYMLEWMHDEDLVGHLQNNFKEKTIEDCNSFICKASQDIANLHMAVVDDTDNYMGTVSLKNIADRKAEFAIAMRKEATGKGYALYGMLEIIKMGFDELQLECIFWCVSKKNNRAIRFYEKNGFQTVDMVGEKITGYSQNQIDNMLWYEIKKG